MTLDFENLDDFFNNKEFSMEVFFGLPGREVGVNCIFDNPHFLMEDSYPDVSTSQPKFTCPTDNVAEFPQYTRVVIGAELIDGLVTGGVEYRIRDKRPDGTGISEVILQKL